MLLVYCLGEDPLTIRTRIVVSFDDSFLELILLLMSFKHVSQDVSSLTEGLFTKVTLELHAFIKVY